MSTATMLKRTIKYPSGMAQQTNVVSISLEDCFMNMSLLKIYCPEWGHYTPRFPEPLLSKTFEARIDSPPFWQIEPEKPTIIRQFDRPHTSQWTSLPTEGCHGMYNQNPSHPLQRQEKYRNHFPAMILVLLPGQSMHCQAASS
jgi:hypothetical protein